MKQATRFSVTAVAGFAAVILFQASGVVISVRQLGEHSEAQLSRIHEEESQITLAERLRGIAAHIAAAARGYVIIGDPTLLTTLQTAEAEFDRGIQTLKTTPLTTEEITFVAELERSATDYRRIQQQLVPRQRQSRWFETELLPSQRAFAQTLDRFVAHEQSEIQNTYVQARQDRAHVTMWIHRLLGLSFLISLVLAGYVARTLVRSYRTADDALTISRHALAGRDELLRIMAHDLRNPIAAIMLRTMAIPQGDLPEPALRQIMAIQNIAMRTEYIIKTMVDVSDLEAGRLVVTPTRWTVDSLIADVVAMFDTIAAPKQVQLEATIAPHTPAVRADRERVLEVLSNLVGNALKVSASGSRVTITVAREADRVSFAVSDTGPAIAGDALEHMFDRYWEGAGERNRASLGLFAAKSLVEAHGGTIRIQSGDRGATFSFALPAAAPTLGDVVAVAPVLA